jgi:hypothetical protein
MRVAHLSGPGAPRAQAGLALIGLDKYLMVPVQPATEVQLRSVLTAQPCPVALLVLDLAAASAGYATVTLADSQGQARKVNAQPLGQLLAQAGVRIVVLASDASSEVRQAVAKALVAKGVGAVVALPQAHASCAPLLSALARGESVGSGVLMNNLGLAMGSRLVVHGDGDRSIGAATPGRQARALPPPAAAPTAAGSTPGLDAPPALLRAKRDANRFDVFLCHNSADKPSVKSVGQRLKDRGILPWLDEWELPPGQPWQALLEQQIARIGSAAVFIGASGISPWHQQEMRGFISEFVDRQVPVIPVLLTDAPDQPELPVFLRQMTWVDFRVTEPDPFERLLWGITGQRPV